jgi:hypothetical protein
MLLLRTHSKPRQKNVHINLKKTPSKDVLVKAFSTRSPLLANMRIRSFNMQTNALLSHKKNLAFSSVLGHSVTMGTKNFYPTYIRRAFSSSEASEEDSTAKNLSILRESDPESEAFKTAAFSLASTRKDEVILARFEGRMVSSLSFTWGISMLDIITKSDVKYGYSSARR